MFVSLNKDHLRYVSNRFEGVSGCLPTDQRVSVPTPQWRVVGLAASKNDFQCFVYADYTVEPCVFVFSSNSNITPEGSKLASIPAEDVN